MSGVVPSFSGVGPSCSGFGPFLGFAFPSQHLALPLGFSGLALPSGGLAHPSRICFCFLGGEVRWSGVVWGWGSCLGVGPSLSGLPFEIKAESVDNAAPRLVSWCGLFGCILTRAHSRCECAADTPAWPRQIPPGVADTSICVFGPDSEARQLFEKINAGNRPVVTANTKKLENSTT